jgi:hypothetical protein
MSIAPGSCCHALDRVGLQLTELLVAFPDITAHIVWTRNRCMPVDLAIFSLRQPRRIPPHSASSPVGPRAVVAN